MKTSFLFFFSLPKRHATFHYLYRRAYRACAYVKSIVDRKITLDTFIVLSIASTVIMGIMVATALVMSMMLCNEIVRGTMLPEQAIATSVAIIVTTAGAIHWHKCRGL
jgi:hypothetical protein